MSRLNYFALRAVATLCFLSTLTTFQSDTYAGTLNYTAGAICVGRTAADEALLKREDGSIFNSSETKDAQVYCSAQGNASAGQTSVRFVVNARQGTTNRNFRGAFGLYHPTTGKQLVGKSAIAENTPDSRVRFGPPERLTAKHKTAFNQVRLWIPPQSRVFSIYTDYGVNSVRPEAFAWANDPTATAQYNALPGQSYNSAGRVNTIRRTREGVYFISFPGVGGSAANVQVTAFRAPGVHCQTTRWVNTINVNVTVSCFNSDGRAADAMFTVAYRGTP